VVEPSKSKALSSNFSDDKNKHRGTRYFNLGERAIEGVKNGRGGRETPAH
jgi:hypothetical protein